MSADTKKRLALAIIDFLATSIKDGTLPEEEAESIEVAQQCISEAFKVDYNDKDAVKDALAGQSLVSIYSVFEKMKKGSSAPAAAPKKEELTEEKKAEAESLKGQGNAAMGKKDYGSAIEFYSKAIKIIPNNPIYLSNRAAAFSASGQHDKAVLDAQSAVDADPKYSKGWSRLGLAKYALGDAKGAMLAYEQGIEAEGNGGSEVMRRGYETAKRKVDEEEGVAATDRGASSSGPGAGGAGGMPDLASLAGMFGGGGAGGPGGSGGAPDLGGLLSNPMFASMAQKLMSNPQLMSSMMNNPKIKDMMNNAGGGGGGMP